MRSWNWEVEVHRNRFPSDQKRIDDDDWVTEIAEKRWVIFTADKDLQFRYHEVIAKTTAAIFVVASLKPKEDWSGWARMIGGCKQQIIHASHIAPRPFVARISHDGHLYKIDQLLPNSQCKDVTGSVEADARAVYEIAGASA